jgi:hypothetical protein
LSLNAASFFRWAASSATGSLMRGMGMSFGLLQGQPTERNPLIRGLQKDSSVVGAKGRSHARRTGNAKPGKTIGRGHGERPGGRPGLITHNAQGAFGRQSQSAPGLEAKSAKPSRFGALYPDGPLAEGMRGLRRIRTVADPRRGCRDHPPGCLWHSPTRARFGKAVTR